MSKKFQVPFNDLYLQNQSLGENLHNAFDRIIRNSSFIRGEDVEEFEEKFARLVGSKHCVSCANGTDALYIAMKALDTGPGDEVIVPAMSWISTSETISQTGARIIFCDIDPETHTIDVTQIRSKVSPNTVGIIPVHLYGFPANMPEIMSIAETNKLWVIEDCAQAHLAKVKGQLVGTFGTAATYSFYPGKNLGALGDAGAITTNEPALARKMAMFARHGGLKKGQHEIEGINSRLDGLQAAVLNLKMGRLNEWTARRVQLATFYLEQFSELPIQLPPQKNEYNPVWHLFVVCLNQRDEFKDYLNAKGIQTVINYPCALPFLPCYSHHRYSESDYPRAHQLQGQCLSLPIFPELSEAQAMYCADAVREFFKSNRSTSY